MQQCERSSREGEGSDASERGAGEQAEGRGGTRKREAGVAKEETRRGRGGRKRILKRKLRQGEPTTMGIRRGGGEGGEEKGRDLAGRIGNREGRRERKVIKGRIYFEQFPRRRKGRGNED